MLNMTSIVNSVMNLLGMKNDFVFYSMTPYDIQEYIEKNTLKTFSRYRPYIFTTVITLRKEDILDHSPGSTLKHSSITYRMPEEILALAKNGLEIFSAGNVIPYSMNRVQNIFGGSYINGIVDLSAVDLGVQAYNMQSYNAVVPRIKAEYIPPNKLLIKNGIGNITENQQYQIRLSCFHSKNLKTMKEGQYEAFKHLALLDIAHFIYHNDLKYMDQVNTGNSNTDLKLDLFEDIDSKRNEFIDELKDTQAIDSGASFIQSL